ncbi:putative purine-cytosine permease [Diplodia seriata]|uniref:Putative purine-cytosine permease n=1 Tax=Diplodia seriata TaxID=420778 RepID=A0A0G2GR66_9PEZI|nr:putative purine-cytosine permease [Diplodia seriata]
MDYVDVEKKAADAEVSSDPSGHKTTDGGAVPGESFEYGNSLYARIQRLAGRFNIEQRGIERVPEDERTDRSLLNVGTMWLSANMVVSSFAIGLLAKSLFYLGVADAMLVCLFFNILGILPVCWFSSFGPVFGLRQMVLSRFWFGWWGVKLIACFNVCACIGWSAVNSIVGAELIHAVNNDVPGWAGIIIIAICTFLVTLFGYKVVHAYEFYSWIPTFIIFLIVLGTFAHSGAFVHIPWGVGKSEMGGVLSFGVTVYGFATGWASYAADYTVYHPSSQSRRKVFLSTAAGLIFPLLFTEMLGIAVMSATAINGGDNRYQVGYSNSGTGGLLAAVLFPPLGGFGKFCLVILALSIVANNSIAIPGYSHFESILENFMNFIGYWLAIYEGIAVTDHFLFKRGIAGYVPEHYDQPSKLPPGIAAVVAFGFGVAGMVTGMSQTWYVGKIALHAGEAPFGGDVGFELGFAFAAVSYAVLRPIELKVFGR